jgi:hypothetical protein
MTSYRSRYVSELHCTFLLLGTASGEVQRICPKFVTGDTSSQMDRCELHIRLLFLHSKECLRVGIELAYTKKYLVGIYAARVGLKCTILCFN